MAETLLIAGVRKGPFPARSPRLFAGARSEHWGPTVLQPGVVLCAHRTGRAVPRRGRRRGPCSERRTDGGQSWTASNTGIKATFLPEQDRYREFGQCVHKITPGAGDRFAPDFRRHVYRIEDDGEGRATVATGLPRALRPRDRTGVKQMSNAPGEELDQEEAATIVIPGALAGFAGGRSQLRVDLGPELEPPRLPLSAVLDELRREVPALERRIRDERGVVRENVDIYLDGVDIRELVGVGTVVVPGAIVQIVAAVSDG